MVAVALPVRVALPEALRVTLPVALEPAEELRRVEGAADEVAFEAPDEEEGKKPLQRPLLHVVPEHCELLVHAALKFPHLAMMPELLAQHSAPPAHWLGLTKGLHCAPRGREPAGAVTVGEGAGVKPPGVLVMVGVADEEAMKPLQRPC